MVAITQSEDLQARRFSNVSLSVVPAASGATTASARTVPEVASRAAVIAISAMVVAAVLVAGLIGIYGGRLIDANRGIPQAVQAEVQGD